MLCPNSTGEQAAMVAERIRHALTKLALCGRDGQPIPPPTVSQGIAVYPLEADQIDCLIDLTDQRLYVAKERGRDQVEPVGLRTCWQSVRPMTVVNRSPSECTDGLFDPGIVNPIMCHQPKSPGADIPHF